MQGVTDAATVAPASAMSEDPLSRSKRRRISTGSGTVSEMPAEGSQVQLQRGQSVQLQALERAQSNSGQQPEISEVSSLRPAQPCSDHQW